MWQQLKNGNIRIWTLKQSPTLKILTTPSGFTLFCQGIKVDTFTKLTEAKVEGRAIFKKKGYLTYIYQRQS